MTIGIAIVCTNAYFVLGIRLVKQFVKFYQGSHQIHFYLFTDTDPNPYLPNYANVHYIETHHTNWCDGTNSKFSNILLLKEEPCDYIYYFDADTSISNPFTEEWFLGDLVGGEHFNNSDLDSSGKPAPKPYDQNPLSKAYVPHDTPLPQMYYYGAFFGGAKEKLLNFCSTLVQYQKEDKLIPYEPCVNDESYINKFFHYNPPIFVVLNRNFAFNISDKGGLGETRKPTLDIEEVKRNILENADKLFTLWNGKVVF